MPLGHVRNAVERELAELVVLDHARAAGRVANLHVVPKPLEMRHAHLQLGDELLERWVAELCEVHAKLAQQLARHRFERAGVALVFLVRQNDPQQIALRARHSRVVAVDPAREVVPGEDVPAPSHHERRHRHELHGSPQSSVRRSSRAVFGARCCSNAVR